MADVERAVSYFACCGEANTEKVLDAVRRRCEERGPGIVFVASETGRSALRSLEAFRGLPIELVVVTHFPAKTQGPRGDIPIGLGRPEYADARRRLLEEGASIVKWTRPFAPPTRSIGWNFPTPEAVVDKTLEVFGAGTKIAVEAAVMATDAGEVAEGEEVVSCAGTFKGLDTALIVRKAHSMNFFKEFEVREVVAKPLYRVRRLPEYKFENWEGDLDKYYPELA